MTSAEASKRNARLRAAGKLVLLVYEFLGAQANMHTAEQDGWLARAYARKFHDHISSVE